jgi:hypothetical protein
MFGFELHIWPKRKTKNLCPLRVSLKKAPEVACQVSNFSNPKSVVAWGPLPRDPKETEMMEL